MNLNLERPGDHLFVRATGKKGIRIGDTFFKRSLIISKQTLIDDWPPQAMAELLDEHFVAVFEFEPEVLLLGTGLKQVFLSPLQMVGFYQRGIGIDVMTSEAACRTFNVLVAEGRNVVAAIMPLNA